MEKQFIEQFKLYKSFALDEYVPSIWERLLDTYFLAGFLTILFLISFFIYPIASIILVPPTLLSIMLAGIDALISSGGFSSCKYFLHKEKKKNSLKRKFASIIYKGSLYEIFDRDNDLVKALLSHNKNELKKELQDYKGIRGSTIIKLWELICEREELMFLVEKRNKEKRRKEDELEVIAKLNTKTSKLIREIDEIEEVKL